MGNNGVVKVFVKVASSYLFSIKKDKGTRSDGLLEHLGGHIMYRESPFEALVREAKEEECSGRLAAELCEQKPVPQELFVKVGAFQEKHYVYQITISKERAAQLEADKRESYGFEFVEAHCIESERDFNNNSQRFTWKTRQIHKALAGKMPE